MKYAEHMNERDALENSKERAEEYNQRIKQEIERHLLIAESTRQYYENI